MVAAFLASCFYLSSNAFNLLFSASLSSTSSAWASLSIYESILEFSPRTFSNLTPVAKKCFISSVGISIFLLEISSADFRLANVVVVSSISYSLGRPLCMRAIPIGLAFGGLCTSVKIKLSLRLFILSPRILALSSYVRWVKVPWTSCSLYLMLANVCLIVASSSENISESKLWFKLTAWATAAIETNYLNIFINYNLLRLQFY